MVRYLDEIDLYRLAARYRRGVPRAESGNDKFTPLEARRMPSHCDCSTSTRTAATRKLRALLELYATEPDLKPREEKCLELVRRQLKQLDQDDGERSEDLARLEARLQAADAETDRQRARAIYSGLVELYADKPWCRQLSRRPNRSSASLPRLGTVRRSALHRGNKPRGWPCQGITQRTG